MDTSRSRWQLQRALTPDSWRTLFSTRSDTLATMGEDGVIKLWDVPAGGR
jgi:hypothetical protein